MNIGLCIKLSLRVEWSNICKYKMVALGAIEEWDAYLWGSPVGGGVYIGSSMAHVGSLSAFLATPLLFVQGQRGTQSGDWCRMSAI